MLFKSELSTFKRQLLHAIFIPLVFCFFIILAFVFEKGMHLDFHTFGVYPRSFKNIGGIFTMVFIHDDWSHLANNVVSFFLLSTCLFYFYRQIAIKVLLVAYIISGVILWIIGRENWHIGASGLIYSLVIFLFFSGVFRKHIPLIALSLIVVFYYGSLVWHLIPWEIHDPISWEGHLAGSIIGLILSILYKSEGPQKPIPNWEEDEEVDEDDEEFYSDKDEDENSMNEIK